MRTFRSLTDVREPGGTWQHRIWTGLALALLAAAVVAAAPGAAGAAPFLGRPTAPAHVYRPAGSVEINHGRVYGSYLQVTHQAWPTSHR